MSYEKYVRVLRVKMWATGHSFEEIDSYSIQDFGDILAYWEETERINKKRRKKKKPKGGA